MDTIILILQIFSCLFLIGLILVQKGQGADLGAAFGGASNTVFGSRGPATFLNKATIIIAVIFLVTSVYLAHNARTKSASSVIDSAKKISADQSEAKKAEDALGTTGPKEEGAVLEEAPSAAAEDAKAEDKGVEAEEVQKEVDKNSLD